MQFQDEVAGGIVLVRPAVQSPNFVTGSAGWSINVDGSAEFNDITIRNATTVGGTILLYNGAPAPGNLVASMASASGTDSQGNKYADGVTAYDLTGLNSGAFASIDSGALWVGTVDAGGPDFSLAGSIQGDSQTATTFITGNTSSTNDLAPTIILNAGDSGGGIRATIDIEDSSVGPVDINMEGIVTTYGGNAFSTFTPTVTGGGVATFTTTDGYYQRIGKIILVRIYIVVNAAGSGAANVQIALPSTPHRAGTRQAIPGGVRDGGIANPGPITGLIFAGGAGATINRIVDSAGVDITGVMLTAGSIWTIEGWYREA